MQINIDPPLAGLTEEQQRWVVLLSDTKDIWLLTDIIRSSEILDHEILDDWKNQWLISHQSSLWLYEFSEQEQHEAIAHLKQLRAAGYYLREFAAFEEYQAREEWGVLEMSELYYTVTRNEIRSDMPAVPVLVSAAGWTVPDRAKKGAYRLRTPPLPEHVAQRAADCGAFVATTRWGGRYRFTPDQYVGWLMQFRPRWAATMDLCCVDMDEYGQLVYPGKQEVEQRQRYTTEMASFFWNCYQGLPVTFCPTVQGWYPDEYMRHAQALAPLINEMFETYWDGGCTDEEQEQEQSLFRVGVGSLCGRDPLLVHEIISTVQAIIGLVPLHLWGTKLQFLRSPIDQGMIASMDSAAWGGLWGPEHDARRQSGLSEARYCWEVSYPRYAERITTAKAQPKFPPLIETSTVPLATLEEAKSIRQPLPEKLCYRKNGNGPE